jgi:hypothetical protein
MSVIHKNPRCRRMNAEGKTRKKYAVVMIPQNPNQVMEI